MSNPETTVRTISQETLASISSFCAADAKVAGTISSSNPGAAYRIEGTLEGEILFDHGGTIHIAKGAKVTKGRIVADTILIEGHVDAKIHARKSLEITANAVVTGELAYDAGLDIHTNARIRASMQFTGPMDDVVGEVIEASAADGQSNSGGEQHGLDQPISQSASEIALISSIPALSDKPRIVGLDSIRAFANSRSVEHGSSQPETSAQYQNVATA